MKDVLVTGGTGFIGRQLTARLDSSCIVTRDVARAQQATWPRGARLIGWADQTRPLDLPADARPEAVVNLMGESVAAKRWNDAFKQRLRTSRIEGTQQLIAGLRAQGKLPQVFVSASAVGYYGDRGEEQLPESATPGGDFLAQLAVDWEAVSKPLESEGVRVVHLRIGIVLGREGGALAEMLPVFRWGVGGRLGSGRQWFPWVHEQDVVGLILWALNNPKVSGPVNAVAPGIVRNQDFTRALGKRLGRPTLLPAPRFGLRLALGEFADSLLGSQRVVPAAALSGGYSFRFPDLEGALAELLPK